MLMGWPGTVPVLESKRLRSCAVRLGLGMDESAFVLALHPMWCALKGIEPPADEAVFTYCNNCAPPLDVIDSRDSCVHLVLFETCWTMEYTCMCACGIDQSCLA